MVYRAIVVMHRYHTSRLSQHFIFIFRTISDRLNLFAGIISDPDCGLLPVSFGSPGGRAKRVANDPGAGNAIQFQSTQQADVYNQEQPCVPYLPPVFFYMIMHKNPRLTSKITLRLDNAQRHPTSLLDHALTTGSPWYQVRDKANSC